MILFIIAIVLSFWPWLLLVKFKYVDLNPGERIFLAMASTLASLMVLMGLAYLLAFTIAPYCSYFACKGW